MSNLVGNHLSVTYLEVSALTEKRGIHSGKDVQPPKQPLNISEVSGLIFSTSFSK